MIVQCPSCETKFRLRDEKVTGKGVKIKCTKCQKIFVVTREGEESAPDPAEAPGKGPESKGAPKKKPAKKAAPDPFGPGPGGGDDGGIFGVDLDKSFEGFNFEDDFGDSPGPAPTSSKKPQKKPAKAPDDFGDDLGFGGFDDDFAAPPPTKKKPQAASKPKAAEEDLFDFGEKSAAPPDAGGGLGDDFDDVGFDDQPSKDAFDDDSFGGFDEPLNQGGGAPDKGGEFDFDIPEAGPGPAGKPQSTWDDQSFADAFESGGSGDGFEAPSSFAGSSELDTTDGSVHGAPDEGGDLELAGFDAPSMSDPFADAEEEDSDAGDEFSKLLDAPSEEPSGEEGPEPEKGEKTESGRIKRPIKKPYKTGGFGPGKIAALVVLLLILAAAGFRAAVENEKYWSSLKLVGLSDEDLTAIKKTVPWPFGEGEKAPEPIKLTILSSSGMEIRNAKGQRLFVIEGKVRNDYPDSRNFIQIRARIRAKNNDVIEEKTVYAGNVLTQKELQRLRPPEIEDRLNNDLGNFNSNTNVAPGDASALDFMVVFYGYQGDVDTYEVFPAGSQGTGE